MAHITNLKYKGKETPEVITYHNNDSVITTIYAGWVGSTEKRYRIQATNTSCFPGNDVAVTLYVDQVSQGTYLIEYESDVGGWTGSLTYDGVVMRLVHTTLQTFNIDEEFTLNRETVTLGENDIEWDPSNKVYKVIFINDDDSYTVFHEQIATPTFDSVDIGPTSITWTYENADADVNVDLYARIGTNSFALKASNVAPGNTGDLEFTSLNGSTQYNVDVYAVQNGTAVKQNSAEATDTRTTTSTTKGWVYQGTTGSYYRSINYYGNNSVCKFAGITPTATGAALESAYPAASEPLGRTGRVLGYNNDFPATLCYYHYFEVEYI